MRKRHHIGQGACDPWPKSSMYFQNLWLQNWKLENQFHLLLLLLWMISWSIWRDAFSSTAWGEMLSTERKTTWAAHTAPGRASPLPSGFIEMCVPGREGHLISLSLWFSMSLSFYVTHTHKMQQSSNTNILQNTTCIFTCVLITGTSVLNSFSFLFLDFHIH